MAEFKAQFVIDDKTTGAMGARAPLPRFALTFPAPITAQINEMAAKLGIDQISLCKALILACVSAYQENPAPFIEEVARAKMRIAESFALAARDLARASQQQAKEAADPGCADPGYDENHIHETEV